MKLITSILTIAAATFAQLPEGMTIGGYMENKTAAVISTNETFTDLAKLRLEAGWEHGKSARMDVHMMFTSALQPLDPFYSIKKGSLLGGITMGLMSGLTSGLDSAGQAMLADPAIAQLEEHLPYSSFYPADEFTMDRAVLKLYFKHLDISLGRQAIAWGTGYAFNPTDIWNIKDPLDADAPKTGLNAFRAEIPLGELSGLDIILSPGRDFYHSSVGGRIKANYAGNDISFSAIKYMNADRELLGLPEKLLLGADIISQIGEVGVLAEAAFNNPIYYPMEYWETDSAFFQADIGVNYTLDNGIYMMAEYYYNGAGSSYYQDYSTDGFIKMMAGEMSGFGQHYVMLGVTKELYNHLMFSGFAIINTTDTSFMLLPEVSYSLSDNVEFKLGIQAAFGDKKKSEYGSMLNSVMFTGVGYF